jgi:cytochrome c oxidase assembly factor CtaG
MLRVWPRRVAELVGHWFGLPWVAWVLYVGVFATWHVPVLYDLALTYPLLHVVEHISYLGTALLFWAQVVPSPPLRRRMSHLRQAMYVVGSAMAMNGLAALYMYSVTPLYPYYARLPRPVGMVSALVDQHIAGAVMDVPGTVLLFIAVSTLILLWLRDDERATDEPARPAAGRWHDERVPGAAAGAIHGDS